jgi:hypothetical protein
MKRPALLYTPALHFRGWVPVRLLVSRHFLPEIISHHWCFLHMRDRFIHCCCRYPYNTRGIQRKNNYFGHSMRQKSKHFPYSRISPMRRYV